MGSRRKRETPEILFGAPRNRRESSGSMSAGNQENAVSQETHPRANEADTLRAKECGEKPRSIREAFLLLFCFRRKSAPTLEELPERLTCSFVRDGCERVIEQMVSRNSCRFCGPRERSTRVRDRARTTRGRRISI